MSSPGAALMSQLIGSVGRHGANQPTDVLFVQRLINAKLPASLVPLKEDGICGSITIDAIEIYQLRVLAMNPPSGQVDPGSATLQSLLEGNPTIPLSGPVPSSQKAGIFPPDVVGAAIASQTAWNVPASVTLAQWALESSWGSKMPADSNNPFGIKAAAGQPFVEAQTREVIHGREVMVMAKFRKFANLDDAFNQHGHLLATKTAYKPAMQVANDPDAFANALTGVYATDPHYGEVLIKLMKKYNLYQYNSTLKTT